MHAFQMDTMQQSPPAAEDAVFAAVEATVLEMLSRYRRLHLEMYYSSMYALIVHGDFKPRLCLPQHKSYQLWPGLSCCHQVALADMKSPTVLEVTLRGHQYDRLQQLSFCGRHSLSAKVPVPSCQCYPNDDDELVHCSICRGHIPVGGLLFSSFHHDVFQNLQN